MNVFVSVRKSEKEDHYRYIETMVVTLGREKGTDFLHYSIIKIVISIY